MYFLFERQRVRGRARSLPSAGFIPEWPQQLEPWSVRVSHVSHLTLLSSYIKRDLDGKWTSPNQCTYETLAKQSLLTCNAKMPAPKVYFYPEAEPSALEITKKSQAREHNKLFYTRRPITYENKGHFKNDLLPHSKENMCNTFYTFQIKWRAFLQFVICWNHPLKDTLYSREFLHIVPWKKSFWFRSMKFKDLRNSDYYITHSWKRV